MSKNNNNCDMELLLQKLRIRCDANELENLRTNIAYLSQRGLSKINDRLIKQNKAPKFLDTLTEHNFTCGLLKKLPDNLKVDYEPSNHHRPPDLHIIFEDISYWIQIKRLSSLMRENKRNKLLNKIEREISQVQVKKFLNINLSEEFNDDYLNELVEYISSVAISANDNNEWYQFVSKQNENMVADINFHDPLDVKLEHLTFASSSDMEAVNITGLAKNQAKSALIKAAGSFKLNSSNNAINIIVVELKEEQAIDFCGALYGTEFNFYNSSTKSYSWSRNQDGVFNDKNFSRKVSGVIAIVKREDKLVSEYRHILCANPDFENLIQPITKLIEVYKIVYRVTYVGNGFFSE